MLIPRPKPITQNLWGWGSRSGFLKLFWYSNVQSGWRTTGLEWDFSDIYIHKDHLGIGRNYTVPSPFHTNSQVLLLRLVQGLHFEEQGLLGNRARSFTLFILRVPCFICLRRSLPWDRSRGMWLGTKTWLLRWSPPAGGALTLDTLCSFNLQLRWQDSFSETLPREVSLFLKANESTGVKGPALFWFLFLSHTIVMKMVIECSCVGKATLVFSLVLNKNQQWALSLCFGQRAELHSAVQRL